MASIKERVEEWIQLGALCEHKNLDGDRDCKKLATGSVAYDLGFDDDAVLSCGEHLVEIGEEVASDVRQRIFRN